MNDRYIDAVIFDLDGVITDTAEYHFLAWKALADQLDIKIDREFNENLKGVSRLDSLELILKHGNRQNDFPLEEKKTLANQKNELYCNYLTNLSPEDILPGIPELIKNIKAEGILIGVASVSKNAGTVLKALGLNLTFDYCVDAAKIKRSKPDPEIFLTACEKLNADPKKSIGIEDAVVGIDAIKASGMLAVGVGTILDRADYKVETTKQLEWTKIKEAYTNLINVKQ